MARSDVVTLIPLDRAARILGIDLFHFNMITTLRRPQNNACDDVWFQYADQRIGQASRYDLSVALFEAEQQTTKYLGFSPMPTWVSDEERQIAKPFAVELVNHRGINSRGKSKSLRTKLGYLREAGVRAKTLIQANAAVVYSDANGDGYSELATVTVNTTVTDTQEIYAYFAGKSGEDRWEIRPIDVSIAGGVATITFQRYLVPLPDLWERDPSEDDPQWRTINGDDIANFVTVVDIYRVYTDETDQATLYYESNCINCNGSGCSACAFDSESACLRIRDMRLGLFSYAAAEWDEDNDRFIFSDNCYSNPSKIIVNYRAGFINEGTSAKPKFPYRQMDTMWERAIVYYAFTLMDRADTNNLCGNTQNIWSTMTEDLASIDNGRSHALSFKHMQNPLGTSRAAINLWRMIEQHRLV